MESLKCNQCDYTTIRSDNLSRHIHLKHSDTIEVFYCDYCYSGFTTMYSKERHMRNHCDYIKNSQNVIKNSQNPTTNSQNPTTNSQNPTTNSQNPTTNSQNPTTNSQNVVTRENEKQCIYCNKLISNKYNRSRHEEKCKKVKSSLECQKCHKIFSNSGSKARHLKTFCKENNNQQLIPLENKNPITNINTQNNNNVNSYNNIHSNNINIITFKQDRMDRISFKRDHLTQDAIDKLVQDALENNATEFPKEFTSRYCNAVLEQPENRCVEKTNLSNQYSKVHIGDNKWRNALDSLVYPKLMSDISEDLYTDISMNKFNMAISKYLRNTLDNFVNYMADYGYCSDEDKEKAIMASYKELVDRIKIMISNFSLEKEEELKHIK
jgi:hypothetical protein